MKPWSHDAGELNPQEIPDTYIYKNPIITEYLEPGSHDRKLFLIGSKGSGKTLLLRFKAYLYWHKMEAEGNVAYRVSASNELVESLNLDLVTLSRKELEKLANSDIWVKIWNFSLALIIIRKAKFALPPEFDYFNDLFPANYRLNNIVTDLINDSPRFISSNFFSCINKMMATINSLQSPFVLFIDRLDQALNSLLINEDYKYFQSGKGKNVPFKIWQNAQYGLLESSYNFSTAVNRHIKIFVTARQEALSVESQLRQNISSYCTFLDYTPNELNEIFENNIRLTPGYFSPAAIIENLYKKFFGFDEMEHIKAKDEHQKKQKEDVFKFLLRHTFGRPREIVLLGRKVYEELIVRSNFQTLNVEQKIENVRRVVNATSHEHILRDYLTEVVPAFHYEYLDECAREFEQNLIHHQDLQKVDSEIINYLYRIGLIGFERSGKQCFLPASKHIHDMMERIPNAHYYMLHPSLDGKMQQTRNFEEFYNEYNIIGNDYPFYPPPLYSARRIKSLDISYYLPEKIPGNGDTTEKWEKNHHIEVDHVSLYEQYFINLSDPDLILSKDQRINQAFKMLSVVANLFFLEKIRSRFSISLKSWETELLTQLSTFRGQSDYSRKISKINLDGLKVFQDKLFGRIITAGMLIYLKPDYGTVHHVIKNFTYTTRHASVNEESAIRYLRGAFFLAGLQNTLHIENVEQNEIFLGLSLFEKDLLKRWWINYTQYDLQSNPHFSSEHKEFLHQEFGMF